MVKKLLYYVLFCCFAISAVQSNAQTELSFNKYHNKTEVQQILKKLNQANSSTTQLHKIAVSPGGEPITILEIGKNKKDVPAIFVGANFEGNVPISTEGALYFANMLLVM